MGSPRGYYMAWGGGRQMPSMGSVSRRHVGELFGAKLKAEARRYFGTFVDLHARGEMIPNEKRFLELDPDKKDRWGIPVPRFHFEWSDYEVQQVAHMQKTFAELIEAAGGKPNPPATDPRKAMTAGGSVNHEIGVTRMSAKPADGVTDPFGKAVGLPERARRRRRHLRLQSLQEPDAHHPRARLAAGGACARGDEKRCAEGSGLGAATSSLAGRGCLGAQ